ncbi:MAG: hypothetical protein ABFE13_18885 [Phycisphaerales bacterium]
MGKKGKLVHHMGMTMTEEQHRKWHRELMQHLGISDEEDRKWHQAQQEPASEEAADAEPLGDRVNPFAIGGGFLAYCVRRGWLIQQGRGRNMSYYVTAVGRKALGGFGITKY